LQKQLENTDKKVSRLSIQYIETEDKIDNLTLRVEKLEQKLAA
jgi:peptidoglycan hydrolase CwlO-like protein